MHRVPLKFILAPLACFEQNDTHEVPVKLVDVERSASGKPFAVVVENAAGVRPNYQSLSFQSTSSHASNYNKMYVNERENLLLPLKNPS